MARRLREFPHPRSQPRFRMLPYFPRADSPSLENCEQAYEQLLMACNAIVADQRVPESAYALLADRVSAFARCARSERLRPPDVLAAMRDALSPLREMLPCDARALVLRAVDDYYAVPASRIETTRDASDDRRVSLGP